jgi:biopolymer transport protein ExbD
MKFKAERGERVELNLLPLIDVVFILLMFFTVTTTFNRNAQLKIELPEASAEAKQQAAKTLELVINSGGRYYIDGRQLVNTRTATLVATLERATQGRKDMPIIISGDKHSPYQAVVTAMDSAAKAGLMHFATTTRQAPSAP